MLSIHSSNIIELTFAEWCSSGPFPIGLAGASIIPDQQVALEAAVGGRGA